MPKPPSTRDEFLADWDRGREAALANKGRDESAKSFDGRDVRARLVAFQHGYNHGMQEAVQKRFGDLPR